MGFFDVYCLSCFEDKHYYVRMVKVGLILDRKDFIKDGYLVNEEQYPRGVAKAARKKGKASASMSQREVEAIEEKEEEYVLKEEDNTVNLSDDKIRPEGGDWSPLTEAHLTSLDVDMDVLICWRNVMTPWSLFAKMLSSTEKRVHILAPLLRLAKQRRPSKVVLVLPQKSCHW